MFGRGENTNLNACVGNNGEPGPEYYSGGYDEAVHILCKAIIKKGHSPDEIVYPILFSARHRVELFLKSQIQYVGMIRERKNVDTAKLIKTHSIEKLWELLNTIAVDCDSRYLPLLDELHEYIEHFVHIDDTGETFRYCYSTEHKKHLQDRALINIEVFYNGYCQLNSIIQRFEETTSTLQGEYATKTFTQSLSRENLVAISKRLPPLSSWGEEVFAIERERIKTDYKLGSKELSDAFNLIKSNRELASNLGCELPLREVSKEKVLQFLEVRHRITKATSALSMKEQFARGHRPEDNELYHLLVESFSVDEMAAILALSVMTSHRYYVEDFDRELQSHKLGDTVKELAIYLDGKSYIAPRVIEGLKLMRLESYLKHLADNGFDMSCEY